MTAIKPIEWRHVKGVPSTKYPINQVCGHPECDKQIEGVHHIFPRSLIGNASYFVEFTPEGGETQIVPHAIGLCGSGTTGHHGDLEEHRAWIRLEDGEYVWLDRSDQHADGWFSLGPLNPQPGSREGKPKRRTRKPSEPLTARPKATYAVRVPKDALENGHEVLTELVQQAREKISDRLGWSDDVPAYFVLTAVLADWLTA